MLTRTLVAARSRLVRITTELSNQIRGVMKTFGLVIPKGKGGVFDANVRTLLAGRQQLSLIITPMLEAWRSLRKQAAELGRQLAAAARQSSACHLLMSIPGVGVFAATSFIAAIEDPSNFRTSRSVGAWLGLTTRRYQSGEVDYDGHISRRGDAYLRCGFRRSRPGKPSFIRAPFRSDAAHHSNLMSPRKVSSRRSILVMS
jgi:transposase